MFATLAALREAFLGWGRHHTAHLAAALAFYLAFSLAPVLVIAIAIAGLIIGQQHAAADVLGPLSTVVGPSGARFLTNLVTGLARPAPNFVAAIVGVGALVLGASGAFTQLQDALNIVFDSRAGAMGVWRLFLIRFFAFVMVVIIGLLLLVMQIFNGMLAGAIGPAAQHAQGAATQVLGFATSGIVIGVLFAALFRYVPAARLQWRDALIGGLFTAALFLLGQWGVSMFVGHTALRSIHGAAAAALIVMTWLYYSSAVVLFGAEFTRAYSEQRQQEALPGLEA